jgi:hypothetical protein
VVRQEKNEIAVAMASNPLPRAKVTRDILLEFHHADFGKRKTLPT